MYAPQDDKKVRDVVGFKGKKKTNGTKVADLEILDGEGGENPGQILDFSAGGGLKVERKGALGARRKRGFTGKIAARLKK